MSMECNSSFQLVSSSRFLNVTVRLTTNGDRANRHGHNLPGRQVAESALIRNRAMAQQLRQHSQSLVGEILVDEGFLSGQRLGCAARRLVIFFFAARENLWV